MTTATGTTLLKAFSLLDTLVRDDDFVYTESELLASGLLSGNVITLDVLGNDTSGTAIYSINMLGPNDKSTQAQLRSSDQEGVWQVLLANRDDPASVIGSFRMRDGKIEIDVTASLERFGVSSISELGDGQVITLSFAYAVSLDADGKPLDWGRVNFTLTGESNQPATIIGDLKGAVVEDQDPNPISGQLVVVDPNEGEARFQEVLAQDLKGTYGTFTLGEVTGIWTYTLDNTRPATQALAQGDQVTETLTVYSFDGTASQTIAVQVTGADEPVEPPKPTPQRLFAGMFQGYMLPAVGTTSGDLYAEHLAGVVLAFELQAGGTAAGGAFTIDAQGHWSYTNKSLQRPATDSFTVRATDGSDHKVSIDFVSSDRISASPTEGDDFLVVPLLTGGDGAPGSELLMASVPEAWAPGGTSLSAGGGDDYVHGSDGDDTLYGQAGADRLDGRGGSDRLYGGTGGDELFGGEGDDGLYGEDGDDWLYGDAGNDKILGGEGNDYLFGGAGADYLDGQAGDDRLFGGPGDDILTAGPGRDWLMGGDGNDQLYSGQGTNVLLGGEGDDSLIIGSNGTGWDPGLNPYTFIDGGVGANNIELGAGTSTLMLRNLDGLQTVQGFGPRDSVLIDASVYAGLNRAEDGRLAPDSLVGLSDDTLLESASHARLLLLQYEGSDAALLYAGADQTPKEFKTLAVFKGSWPDISQIHLSGVDQGWVTKAGMAFTVGQLAALTDDAYGVPDTLEGQYGQFRLDANGAWMYTLDNSLPSVIALQSGQTLLDTLTVTTQSGQQETITVTITGQGEPRPLDVLIAGLDVAYLTAELHGDGKSLRTSGKLLALNLDTGEAVAFVAVSEERGFSIDAQGNWTFSAAYPSDGADPEQQQFVVSTTNGAQHTVSVTLDRDGSGVTTEPTVGNDVVLSTADGAILDGLDGDDYLAYATGNGVFNGGAGDDKLLASTGSPDLYGGQGRDSLYGGTGEVFMYGGADDDRLFAGATYYAEAYGEAGDDILVGGAGFFEAQGGEGNDVLIAGADGGRLFGGDGNDRLYTTLGGSSSTYLVSGGAGSNDVYLGSGSDAVILEGGAMNRVVNFDAAADRLVIRIDPIRDPEYSERGAYQTPPDEYWFTFATDEEFQALTPDDIARYAYVFIEETQELRWASFTNQRGADGSFSQALESEVLATLVDLTGEFTQSNVLMYDADLVGGIVSR